MDKTINITIGGEIFHIEGDAFIILEKYLNTINEYFSQLDDKDEIIADIEARISELLSEKIADANPKK